MKLTTARSIFLGSLLVAASLSAHLIYEFNRDQLADEAKRGEAVLALAEQRRIHSKQAWDVASKNLSSSFRWYLVGSRGRLPLSLKQNESIWIRGYRVADVIWCDARHVTISGYIMLDRYGNPDPSWVAWEADLELLDTGGWGYHEPKFSPANVSPQEVKTWFKQQIDHNY